MESVVLQLDLYSLFANTFFFLTFIVFCATLIGLFSKSFLYAAYSGFLVYASLTIQTGFPFYENLLLVIVTIIVLFMAFRTYGNAFGGSSGVES